MEKKWIVNKTEDYEVLDLIKKTGWSPLLCKILCSRGFTYEKAKEFLNPDLKDMHDPFLLKDMNDACDRILEAVKKKEKILIYGDYDVDGVTSTSILINFLNSLCANVEWFIPDRVEEGYGLSVNALEKVFCKSPNLVITVDCGITSFEEVKYITEKGIDIIITDHHECLDILPEALAVVNPHREDCIYPFKNLAGAGVTLKLVQALCSKLELADKYLDYLEFAAIGTVADVVPLIGENRIIVYFGLERLKNPINIGIRALIEESGLKDKVINSYSLGFVIGPRINAAGRLGSAGRAINMFTTDNFELAHSIASELNEENKNRQQAENEILQEVIKIIEEKGYDKDLVIVAEGERWHHGVIGIVSSRITERYNRPSILLSVEEDIAKGSGRSIEGMDLFQALKDCSDCLVKFGGHELAAGLTIETNKIDIFRKKINGYASKVLNEFYLVPRIKADTEIDLKDATLENVKELEKIAPFGCGNPSPVLVCEKLKIRDLKTVGESRHLKLQFEHEGRYIDSIGFNLGDRLDKYSVNDLVDVICTLDINNWNNMQKVQICLKDIRICASTYMENRFYESLFNCMPMCFKKADKKLYDINWIEESSIDLLELIANDDTLVICNNLLSLRKIVQLVDKLSLTIKKGYKICYNTSIAVNRDKLTVLVNPTSDTVYNGFNNIVFYGPFLNENYIYELIEDIGQDKNLKFIEDSNLKTYPFESVILERKDCEAVYRYLTKNGKKFVLDNLHKYAAKISKAYSVNINYNKLAYCLGIFEELGLMKLEQIKNNNYSVTFVSVKSSKKLEETDTFNRLRIFAKYNIKNLQGGYDNGFKKQA